MSTGSLLSKVKDQLRRISRLFLSFHTSILLPPKTFTHVNSFRNQPRLLETHVAWHEAILFSPLSQAFETPLDSKKRMWSVESLKMGIAKKTANLTHVLRGSQYFWKQRKDSWHEHLHFQGRHHKNIIILYPTKPNFNSKIIQECRFVRVFQRELHPPGVNSPSWGIDQF